MQRASNHEPVSRQERREKRLRNRRKMAVHGQRIRKQPKGGSLDSPRKIG